MGRGREGVDRKVKGFTGGEEGKYWGRVEGEEKEERGGKGAGEAGGGGKGGGRGEGGGAGGGDGGQRRLRTTTSEGERSGCGKGASKVEDASSAEAHDSRRKYMAREEGVECGVRRGGGRERGWVYHVGHRGGGQGGRVGGETTERGMQREDRVREGMVRRAGRQQEEGRRRGGGEQGEGKEEGGCRVQEPDLLSSPRPPWRVGRGLNEFESAAGMGVGGGGCVACLFWGGGWGWVSFLFVCHLAFHYRLPAEEVRGRGDRV